jgi:hypothetical protein
VAVIINELEHVPAPAESRSRGGGGGAEGAPAAASPAATIQALRREASRQARLAAD